MRACPLPRSPAKPLDAPPLPCFLGTKAMKAMNDLKKMTVESLRALARVE